MEAYFLTLDAMITLEQLNILKRNFYCELPTPRHRCPESFSQIDSSGAKIGF